MKRPPISHAAYFSKNVVAIRAEQRALLTVYRPSAFFKVTRIYQIPLPMAGILDYATFSNIRENHKELYGRCLSCPRCGYPLLSHRCRCAARNAPATAREVHRVRLEHEAWSQPPWNQSDQPDDIAYNLGSLDYWYETETLAFRHALAR